MACLDETALVDLVSRGLGVASAEQDLHLRGCALCRRALAAMADPETLNPGVGVEDSVPADGEFQALHPGDALNRFVVLHQLGQGGMGRVYAAYDPQLDRKVALKQLDAHVLGEDDVQVRTLREAQAMAQLTHPHVVAVYAVERVDRRLFIAMEYVGGGNLRQWLNTLRRPWHEIVQLFAQAGRGLACAHQAGIVHRDFKPENVLIDQRDQAKVTDFGLARPVDDRDATTVAGTPQYMAPEQRRGDPCDARADQYSFCVALREALSDASGVSPRIGRALERGTAAASAERFESMGALLLALEGPSPRRYPRIGVFATALALFGALAVAALWSRARSPIESCRSGPDRLRGVWDDPARARIAAAFTASGSPSAQAVWSSVQSALDQYFKAWTASQQRACALLGDAAGPRDIPLAELACLERRWSALRGLSDVLAHATRPGVDEALQSLEALDSVAACNSPVTAGVAPPVVPVALRPAAEALEESLAQARVLRTQARFLEAEQSTTRVALGADRLHLDSLAGRAYLLKTELEIRTLQLDAAVESADRSAQAAERAADAQTRTRAYLKSAHALTKGSHFEQAREQLARADMALSSLPGPHRLQGEVALARAILLDREHMFEPAATEARRAAGLLETTLGPESILLTYAWMEWGTLLIHQGDPSGLSWVQRALELRTRRLGPYHPDVLLARVRLGEQYLFLNRLDDAVAALRDAVRDWNRLGPPDAIGRAHALVALGRALVKQGHSDEGRPLIEEARAVRARPDPDIHAWSRALETD